MQDAAVDHRDRNFLVVVATVAADEMPSLTGDVFVDARHWGVPVLFAADRPLNALSTLEPVRGTEDGAQAKE